MRPSKVTTALKQGMAGLPRRLAYCLSLHNCNAVITYVGKPILCLECAQCHIDVNDCRAFAQAQAVTKSTILKDTILMGANDHMEMKKCILNDEKQLMPHSTTPETAVCCIRKLGNQLLKFGK